MNHLRRSLNVLAFLAMVVLCSTAAHAQATRTWVSGVGDDANPCSRTAPCKTFAGAISKTAPGGEINCLDPGGFGALTITKSIMIACDGTYGSVLVAGTNGIVVAAGASDVVMIKGLHFDGLLGSGNANAGLNGIRFISGKSLLVEDVVIVGFSQAGLDIETGSANSRFTANNVTITNCGTGVLAAGASSTITADVDLFKLNISMISGNGIQAGIGSAVIVRDSNVSFTNVGFNQTGSSGANITNSQFFNNQTGVLSSAGGVSVSGNLFILDSTVFNQAGGSIYSDGTNQLSGGSPGTVSSTVISKM